MMRPDEHQLWQDDRAAELRDRDRQREPGSSHRRPNLLARRRAFQAGVQDSVNRAHAFTDEDTLPGADSEVSIVKLACPSCANPVFVCAPARDGERITCRYCTAPLSIRNTDDGGVAVERVQLTRGVP